MYYCRNCGAALPDEAAFCRNCGAHSLHSTILTQNDKARPAQTNEFASDVVSYHRPSNTDGQPVPSIPQPMTQQSRKNGEEAYLHEASPATVAVSSQKHRIWPIVLIGLLVILLCIAVGMLTKSNDSTLSLDPMSSQPMSFTMRPKAVSGSPIEKLDGIIGNNITGVPFRDYYITPLGDGKDTITLMIYMIGSDLETQGRAATQDLQEMMRAQLGDNVNVIVQTGGCRRWGHEDIQNGKVQRWVLRDGALEELQNLGRTQMLTSDALTDFIRFSAQNYPASRYGIVFWDHGGGSLYGFGYDELFPDDVLYLPDIAKAMENSGILFDFVGFDACLMATMEVAYMLEPYADYLIASEETEPSEGWEYEDWLSKLSANPSADTVEIGRWIVDDYVVENGETETLSVVSLREIPYVYKCLGSFYEEAHEALLNRQYNFLSAVRADTKYFATQDYDLIDIVDFAMETGFDSANTVIEAVDSAVKYRSDSTIHGIYGLSMYFPYTDVSVYDYAKSLCAEIGFSGDTYRFFDGFVSVLATGQYAFGEEEPAENPDEFSWYDDEAVESEFYTETLESLEVQWSDSLDEFIVPITDEQWERITGVHLTLFYDDGDGYIDLGRDQVFLDDGDGNLILNFDNTWVAIDGMVVPYYAERIDETNRGVIFSGYVPATLNGEHDIQLILQWRDNADNGYIAGYRYLQDGGTLGKGLLQLKEGDRFQVYCNYYHYDGTFGGKHDLGDEIVVASFMPKVTYEDVGDAPVKLGYHIIDIYQNEFYTEFVTLEMD